MPLPKPRRSQTRRPFLNACMASGVMRREFPAENVRYAVCCKQWRRRTIHQAVKRLRGG